MPLRRIVLPVSKWDNASRFSALCIASAMPRRAKPRICRIYLKIVRSLAPLRGARPTPAAPPAFQKGASLTRSDKPAVPDAAEILRAVGEAAYEWRLDTDALAWSDNAAAVLGIADTRGDRERPRFCALASKPRPGRAAPTR